MNRTVRELAQEQLFHDVLLEGPAQARRFLNALELTGRGPGVRSVRFGRRQTGGAPWGVAYWTKFSFAGSKLLGELLRATPEVQTV